MSIAWGVTFDHLIYRSNLREVRSSKRLPVIPLLPLLLAKNYFQIQGELANSEKSIRFLY